MDPTGLADFLVGLVNHRHVKTGIGFGLIYLGATMVQWSIAAPMPQEAILAIPGIVFIVGGGAYVLWRLWER